MQDNQFLARLHDGLGAGLLGRHIGGNFAAAIQYLAPHPLSAQVIQRGICRGAGQIVARRLDIASILPVEHIQENVLHQILGVRPTTYDMAHPPHKPVTLAAKQTAQLKHN